MGIVHRDIKSENIPVDVEGSTNNSATASNGGIAIAGKGVSFFECINVIL
jgi:serine/threonine protein kinase